MELLLEFQDCFSVTFELIVQKRGPVAEPCRCPYLENSKIRDVSPQPRLVECLRLFIKAEQEAVQLGSQCASVLRYYEGVKLSPPSLELSDH